MGLFTKEVNREIENIYKDFEGCFYYAIRDLEQTFYEINSGEGVELEYDEMYEIITKNEVVDEYYKHVLKEIKFIVLDQFNHFNSLERFSFIEKNRDYFNDYTPEKRKQKIYNDYLVKNIAGGDESILKGKYVLSEYDKRLLKFVYEKHLIAYKELEKIMEGVFERVSLIPIHKETQSILITENLKEIKGKEQFKIKTPKLNDHNKPELTQNQISILFKLFKDKRLFSNRDIDKTDFAKIISELTGYSENTLRQNFSKENIIISDNPNDYETISIKLKEVIKELDKLGKEINK